MAAWKDIRLFVSSTFRDMQAERDYLVKKVFPRLRAALEPHRVRLTEIDLRWGITEEQERNDEVLEFCLREVDRCRPFFLGLLGERHGTVPRLITPQVAQRFPWVPTVGGDGASLTELEILHGVLNSPLDPEQALFYLRDPAPMAGVPSFARAFLTDTTGANAGPARRLAAVKLRLRQAGVVRHECYPWRFAGLKIRWQLASAALGLPLRQRLETHLREGLVPAEEIAALESDPLLADFLRSYATVELAGLEALGTRVFNDLWRAIATRVLGDATLSPDAPTMNTPRDPTVDATVEKSSILRGWIKHKVGQGSSGGLYDQVIDTEEWHYHIRRSLVYEASRMVPMLTEAGIWYDRRKSDDGVHLDLKARLEVEKDFHDRFADSRLRGYVRRTQAERLMVNHLLSQEGRVLVLRGQAGAGKSALMARAYRVARWLTRKGTGHCVSHFVGAAPESATQRGLLAHLCMEFGCLPQTEAGELPLDVEQLAALLSRRLAQNDADKGQRVVLIVDALDQLEPMDGAHDLAWLPLKLAENVRVILSLADSEHDSAAGWHRLNGALAIRECRELHLGDHPLDDEACLRLLRRIPSLAAKTLSPGHTAMLLRNRATRNPLYLRVALEELRSFGSHELLSARIQQMEKAEGPTSLFQQVIEWACLDFRPLLVRSSLSAVAASRQGMSEAEICHYASASTTQDGTEGRDANATAEETAALLKHLAAYFHHRGQLLDFHHGSLRQAVQQLWLDQDTERRATHLALADFFEGSKSANVAGRWGARALSETFFHRLAARDWRGMVRLLDDDDYCRERGRSPGYRDFAQELAQAFIAAPETCSVSFAVAFSRVSDQQLALNEVSARVLTVTGRTDPQRLRFMAGFFGSRGKQWRNELLMAASELVGIGHYSGAEALLEALESSYEGPEQIDTDRITALQHMATIRSGEGRHDDAVRLIREATDMAERLSETVHGNILKATLVSTLMQQGKHNEARDLALHLWKHERATLSRSITPRAFLYAFEAIRTSLPAQEFLAMGDEASSIAKEMMRFNEYALLKRRLAQHALQSRNHGRAIELLKEALALPADAYAPETRAGIELDFAALTARTMD